MTSCGVTSNRLLFTGCMFMTCDVTTADRTVSTSVARELLILLKIQFVPKHHQTYSNLWNERATFTDTLLCNEIHWEYHCMTDYQNASFPIKIPSKFSFDSWTTIWLFGLEYHEWILDIISIRQRWATVFCTKTKYIHLFASHNNYGVIGTVCKQLPLNTL